MKSLEKGANVALIKKINRSDSIMIEFSFKIQKKKKENEKKNGKRATDRPSQRTTSINVLSAPLAHSFLPPSFSLSLSLSSTVNESMTILREEWCLMRTNNRNAHKKKRGGGNAKDRN